MRKLTCALMLVAIAVGALVFVGDVHASTPVAGLINSSDVWTKPTVPMCSLVPCTLTPVPL